MLQQTTVDVVAPRYQVFLDRFPDPASLAAASEDEVVVAWAGLGYYRRARALHRGARDVVERHGGRIPEEERALRELPGVGPYTAAAIAAQAFGRVAVPVDGNVARVAARLFAESGDVGSAAVRRKLGLLLRPFVPVNAPGAFAEALIELGALVCRPRDPDCGSCPVETACAAALSGRANTLPVRRRGLATIAIRSLRAWVRDGSRLLLVRRPDGETLLPGFWELPGVWLTASETAQECLPGVLADLGLETSRVGAPVAEATHTITRYRIRAGLHPVSVSGEPRAPARWLHPTAVPDAGLTTETVKLLRGLERGV